MLAFAASVVTMGVLALSATSCSNEVRSCELETRAIAMRVTVTDKEGGVEIELIVEVGSDEEEAGTPLELCPDEDHLTVNGIPAKLTRALGQLYYHVEFPEPVSEYRIDLTRDDFDDARITVLMPPPMDILAPTEGMMHKRSDPLPVAWQPTWPDHELDLAIEDQIGSDCITGLGFTMTVPDNGMFEVPGGAIFDNNPSQTSCAVSAVLTRDALGQYPPELHPSGSVQGFVKRRRGFVSQE